MYVFAFDRDWTVDVNPHPRREAVPLEWVRHLAHETDHAVYAIGNQDLADEAAVPGVVDVVGRHPDDWDEWLGGKRPDGRYERFPTRRERLALVADLHPDADRYVVVDDLDLGDVAGWEHYHAWEFVPAVERGDLGTDLPWARVRTDGGTRADDDTPDDGAPADDTPDDETPARETPTGRDTRPAGGGIVPGDVDHLRRFLAQHETAPGFELRYDDDGTERTRLLAAVSLVERTAERPAAAPAVRCVPFPPAADAFTVRVDAIDLLSTADPPQSVATGGAETPADEAAALRRLSEVNPHAVSVPAVLTLLDRDDRAPREQALHALQATAEARPTACTPALPVLRWLLDHGALAVPEVAPALASVRAVAAASPADVAPLVDVVTPYLTGAPAAARREAARCLQAVADADPADAVDAVPALTTLVEDEADGQTHAIYALSCVSREFPSAVAPVADTLAERVLDADCPTNARLNATAALGRVVDDQPGVAPDIVDDVVDLLDAEHPKLRANALGLVSDASRHSVDVRPYLDRFVDLLTEDDAYARINASATVARVASEFPGDVAPHADTLVDLLGDDRELVRQNACWGLGNLGPRAVDADVDAVSALEDVATGDDAADVRVRAQWALARMESK